MFNKFNTIISYSATAALLLFIAISTYQRYKINSLQREYNQSIAINKQLISNQKKLQSINDVNYQSSLIAINEKQTIEDKYNKLNTELNHVKDRLNKSNVIRDNFLRYINATNQQLSEIPGHSTRIDDTTATYTPTEVAQFLNNKDMICETNTNRLIQLQYNVKRTILIFNGD